MYSTQDAINLAQGLKIKENARERQFRNIVQNHEATIVAKLTEVTPEALPHTCPLYGFRQSDPTGFQHPLGCYATMQGRCTQQGILRESPVDYLGCPTFGKAIAILSDNVKTAPSSVAVDNLRSLANLVRK